MNRIWSGKAASTSVTSAASLPPVVDGPDGALWFRWAKLGEEDQGAWAEERLRRADTSARALILAMLASLEVDVYLRAGGLGEDDLTASSGGCWSRTRGPGVLPVEAG